MRNVCAMSNKVLQIVHQRQSDPGRVGLRLRTLGYEIEVCRHASCEHPLPENFEDYAGVVVFGGPMSANDDHEDYIRSELEWIPKVIESGTPFLGICLGAQLMSRAAGGTVSEHPHGEVEIGYYPVCATRAGADIFLPEMHIFQWHREGFSIPESGTLLATGNAYENQAFSLADHALGIQFHPEVTEQMNRRWLIAGAERLQCPGARPAETHMPDRAKYDPIVDGWVDGFLQGWLDTDRRGIRAPQKIIA